MPEQMPTEQPTDHLADHLAVDLAVDLVSGQRTSSLSGACLSCGSPQARRWSTPDGPALLCPPCATLHGFGCP